MYTQIVVSFRKFFFSYLKKNSFMKSIYSIYNYITEKYSCYCIIQPIWTIVSAFLLITKWIVKVKNFLFFYENNYKVISLLVYCCEFNICLLWFRLRVWVVWYKGALCGFVMCTAWSRVRVCLCMCQCCEACMLFLVLSFQGSNSPWYCPQERPRAPVTMLWSIRSILEGTPFQISFLWSAKRHKTLTVR